MSTSSCVNTVPSNTVPLSVQTFIVTSVNNVLVTMSTLYHCVNIVPLCPYYTTMSTMYLHVYIMPSCQHCTTVSMLYHYVNIVPLCQYCTTVSICYYCVNIVLLYTCITISHYQVNIVPKSLCQQCTMLNDAIWIEC